MEKEIEEEFGSWDLEVGGVIGSRNQLISEF